MDHEVTGNTLVLRGVLDVRVTAELREVVYDLIEHTEGTVVIDLAGVESVDMTSLKLLAVANRVAHRRGGRVVLRDASSGVRRLLHLTHLRSVLPLEPPAGSASQPTAV